VFTTTQSVLVVKVVIRAMLLDQLVEPLDEERQII
jgi:hypothetical protein